MADTASYAGAMKTSYPAAKGKPIPAAVRKAAGRRARKPKY